jgi:hypothetical protein
MIPLLMTDRLQFSDRTMWSSASSLVGVCPAARAVLTEPETRRMKPEDMDVAI